MGGEDVKAHEELWVEWDRADYQFGHNHFARLMKFGVAPPTVLRCPLGFERVETEGALYSPSNDGQGAVILPVFEWVAGGPFLDEDGRLLAEPPEPELVLADLAAWLPSDPGRWWLRRNAPATMLGRENLEDAARGEAPIQLFKEPLAWLQDGGHGVVILNSSHLQYVFQGLPEVICEDIEHGRWFANWMKQPTPPIPAISVTKTSLAA